MTSFLKAMLGVTISLLLARMATITGIEDHEPTWQRVGMLFLSFSWMTWSLWHGIKCLCSDTEM